jgi:hypothetical protein
MKHQDNTKENSRRMITRHAAVERYSLCLRSIDSLLAEGVLPSIRLSKRCLRIPLPEADEALLKFRTGGQKS